MESEAASSTNPILGAIVAMMIEIIKQDEHRHEAGFNHLKLIL